MFMSSLRINELQRVFVSRLDTLGHLLKVGEEHLGAQHDLINARLAADMLRFILEREGYVVTHAADGRLARQAIEQSAPPALAVLDIDLPYHDGFELIETIRADARWRDVPILMLSSKGTELDIARALDAGADDFIVKPFQLEELKARVRRRIRVARP